MRYAAVLGLVAACGGGGGASADGPSIDRGPDNIPIDGDPNGAYWDPVGKTLYLADQQGNQILTWTDAVGFGTAIPLTGAPAGDTELGGLAATADGTLLTPRFGFGTAGGMIAITNGAATNLPNLDVTRRRLGVAVAGDGTIVDTYFIKTTTRVGAVETLTLDGTETDLIPNLGEPVGVAVIGTTVYASDQATNTIVSTPLGTVGGTTFAQIDGPDLMTPGPDGTLFSGSTMGNVYQISATGDVTTFQSGFMATRGVAYDAVNKRLFVAEHVTTGTVHALHIFPVGP